MKRATLFFLAVTTASSCLFAQTTKNPFSELGYKKQITYTSSKGEFEEFHDKADVVEIGTVYYNTKTNKVLGYVNEEKENAEVATATSAMSVDPLCEKYYWISPYAFCLNNPVNAIDPDGMDVWEINKKGEVTWKEKSETHRLYSLDKKGNRSENYVEVKDRNIFDQLTEKRENYDGNFSETKNNGNEVLNVFEFAAKNSDVEWNFSGYEKNTYVLSTSHLKGKVIPVDKEFGYKGEKEVFGVHSHPFEYGTKGPSDMDVYGQQNINPASNKYIFHPASNTWYKYSSRYIDPKYKQWNGVHSTQKIPRPTLKLLKL